MPPQPSLSERILSAQTLVPNGLCAEAPLYHSAVLATQAPGSPTRPLTQNASTYGVPSQARDAEWFFLKGSVLHKKGWLEEAYNHFATACRMDPNNFEYRQALNRSDAGRHTGSYHTGPATGQGCSTCDVCQTLICMDCCCECMGGDLIACC